MPALDLTDRFLPGLGQQHVIGSTNLGVTVVITTLGANTAMTAAQLIASPSNNTTNIQAVGVVIHSLGVPPSWVTAMPYGTSLGGAPAYVYVTADNSAVYMQVFMQTGIGVLNGIGTRIVCVR